MKKFAFIISAFLIVALLFGGCCSQKEKEFNQQVLTQAWDTIKDIPLPDAGYSSVNGHKLVWLEVKIKIDGYNTVTGEPYLMVTCEAKDPAPPIFRIIKRSDYVRGFILLLPYGSAQEVLVAERGCILLTDKAKFTLSELRELHDMFHWSGW